MEIPENNQIDYNRIADLSLDLICIAGIDGYFKYLNPAWENILGYTRDELLSKPFLDFIHPDDHAKNDEEVAKLTAGYQAFHFENRYIHKDGSIRHISWSAQAVADEKEIYCIGRDITESKQTERLLKESEEKYKIQFEEALDAIVLADAETGIIVDCNRATAEMVGRSKADLIGKHQQILHPPEEVEGEFSRTFAQHLRENEGQSLETQVITKNGEIKEVSIKANMFKLRDKKFLQGIFHDVTKRKQAAEQRERLILDLQKALSKIKTLSGLLPICAHCKNIRDDEGYWDKIESYIYQHSDAEFSHSICPECAKKYFPDMNLYDDKKEDL